ncbi:MAG: hypothetical protein SFU53_10145 [Terrimicrobiaceae bacterium]|nr:hypothetical protein [Terrimicrobiaceae bacterium]
MGRKSKRRKIEAPVTEPSPPPGRPVITWIVFALVVLSVVGWIAFHTALVDVVTVRACENADRDLPAAERLPVFLSEIAFDGYVWNRHAEKLGEDGRWRLRFTDFDNAPTGREVHWNSGFAWYLRGLGEIYRTFTGESLRNSIFRMSIWANPILLALAVVIFGLLAAGRFGPLAGSVVALGMIWVPTFYEGFMPAYPDHHGLIALFIFGSIFGIAWAGAGWVKTSPDDPDFAAAPDIRMGRRGMILSAVCGAAGLWVSALSMAFVLAAAGLAALICTAIFGRGRPERGANFEPSLWKTWALWGAGASLVFYALEYFPNHLGMRLEVNHPLYALAWLGGGWAVAEIADWLRRPELNRFPWARLILPAVACAVLPAWILIARETAYSPFDPFLLAVHRNILEFLPLLLRFQIGSISWQAAFGLYPFLLLAALVLVFVPRTGRGTRAAILFLVFPIAFATVLQFYQTRWGMLNGPLYLALALLLIPELWRLVPRRAVFRIPLAVVLLAFSAALAWPSFQAAFPVLWHQARSETLELTIGQARALLHRAIARAIQLDAGDKPVVLLSSPNTSALVGGLGGFRTVGTLYWENSAGLQAAARMLNAQTESEALRLLREHGITHVALMNWENFVSPYFDILYPKPPPGVSVQSSFAKRAIADRIIPPWARPLVFRRDSLVASLNESVLLLRFEPGQTSAEAHLHLARFVRLVEGNPVAAEVALREIVTKVPDFVPARLELADLKASQGLFPEAVDQIRQAMLRMSPADADRTRQSLIAALQKLGRQDLADQVASENFLQPTP